MKKFEYKLITFKTKGVFSKDVPMEKVQNEFSELGEHGWEFAESQRIESNGWTDRIIFVFKREKKE
jgi:hypothetical protein